MPEKMSKAQKEQRANEICDMLPFEPSKRVKEDFMAETYQNIRSVFRSIWLVKDGKKEKVVAVTCGGCLARSIFPYRKSKHGSAGCCLCWPTEPYDEYGFFDERDDCIKYTNHGFLCPFCRRMSTLYGWSRMKYQPIASASRYAQEVKAIGGHAVVMLWKLYKSIDRDGKETFGRDRLCASFQISGRMFRANGYDNYCGNKYFTDEWLICRNYREGIGGVAKRYTYYDVSEIEETEEGNDGLLTMLRYGDPNTRVFAERYLSLWSKAPNIENVAKTYPEYMNGLLSTDCRSTVWVRAKRYLDLRKTKPHEIAGVEKEEAREIMPEAKSPENVYLYKMCRSHKVDEAKRVLSVFPGQASSFLTFLDNETVQKVKPRFEKLINYMFKSNWQLATLRDYWNMTLETEKRVSDEMMFPKDLRRAHDRAVERYEAKKNRKENEQIKNQAEKLKKYIFTDAETMLCIRPVGSCAELIREGRELHHCVASYAKNVAQGKTSIFLIRRIDAPDVPFYTLELRNGKIIQDHGLKNCLQTPEVLAFEKKWIEFIKGVERNGKRIAANADRRTGA